MSISRVGGFLRNYEFLDLTKSVTEAQIALYKKPNKTWSQVIGKLCNISWYNGLSILAVGTDVATYLSVSTLRGVGFFCPILPQPPVFPVPHDNVQFLGYAIQRALWGWDSATRHSFEEDVESSFSNRWNIFQVVGEWSLAYSLENIGKNCYYKPTFLTISEPLEDGTSFWNVEKDFVKLGKKDQEVILYALYHQSDSLSLGSKAKKVYQNIRSLASKLHQGNQNYLIAFNEYVKQKNERSISIPLLTEPSAPPFVHRNIEVEMAENISFLRDTLFDLSTDISNTLRLEVLNDQTRSGSSMQLLAHLTLLRGFQEAFQHGRSDLPAFLPWNETLRSGKSFRAAGQNFSRLTNHEFGKLREAIAKPWRRVELPLILQERLNEVIEFGSILSKNRDFIKTYDALRIDLLAN